MFVLACRPSGNTISALTDQIILAALSAQGIEWRYQQMLAMENL